MKILKTSYLLGNKISYFFTESLSEFGTVYGIGISMNTDEFSEENEVVDFSSNRDFAEDFYNKVIDGAVFPSTLLEVAENYLAEISTAS